VSSRRDIDKKQDQFDQRLEEMGIRIKDADQFKVREDVFDEVTLLALYKLVHKKWLSAIGGSISTGKEANVFYGERDGAGIAIKIYRIQTANFTTMSSYIIGDRRFSHVKKAKKELIFAWTRKEFSNLVRARDAGIAVPEPLVWDRNILVMSFIGEGEIPYPQLRNVELEDPAETYALIAGIIDTLYNKAELVHADLSEFNILYGDKPYIIDMGQSVTRDHPRALPFLMRDIRNINRFFKNRCDVRTDVELFNAVTGRNEAEP
jgi:RIO kinase 1